MAAGQYLTGTLPRDWTAYQLEEVTALPEELQPLFAVPISWFAQLTLPKINILVQAFISYNQHKEYTQEHLVQLIQNVFKARTGAACTRTAQPPTLNNMYLAGRDMAVGRLVNGWMERWGQSYNGSRILGLTFCCAASGMGQTYLLKQITNPPDYLVPTYVRGATMWDWQLSALMVVLCSKLVEVPLDDLSPDKHSLEAALIEAFNGAAVGYKLPLHPGGQWAGQWAALLECTVTDMIHQNRVPYMFVLDHCQVLEDQKYAHYFSADLAGVPLEDHPRMKMQALWKILHRVVSRPHVFVHLASCSHSLAHLTSHWRYENTISELEPPVAQVEPLPPLSAEDIKSILRQTRNAEDGALLTDKLSRNPDDEWLERLCRMILDKTEGVPSAIQAVLKECVASSSFGYTCAEQRLQGSPSAATSGIGGVMDVVTSVASEVDHLSLEPAGQADVSRQHGQDSASKEQLACMKDTGMDSVVSDLIQWFRK